MITFDTFKSCDVVGQIGPPRIAPLDTPQGDATYDDSPDQFNYSHFSYFYSCVDFAGDFVSHDLRCVQTEAALVRKAPRTITMNSLMPSHHNSAEPVCRCLEICYRLHLVNRDSVRSRHTG